MKPRYTELQRAGKMSCTGQEIMNLIIFSFTGALYNWASNLLRAHVVFNIFGRAKKYLTLSNLLPTEHEGRAGEYWPEGSRADQA